MPVLVGDGTTGSEGKSDRLGIATGSSDPGSGAAGDLYFNTGSSKLKYFNGTAWNELGTATSTVGNIDPFADSSGIALWQMDGNGDDVGGSNSGAPTNVVWSNTAKFGANSADFATVAKGADRANIISAPIIVEINFLIFPPFDY